MGLLVVGGVEMGGGWKNIIDFVLLSFVVS